MARTFLELLSPLLRQVPMRAAQPHHTGDTARVLRERGSEELAARQLLSSHAVPLKLAPAPILADVSTSAFDGAPSPASFSRPATTIGRYRGTGTEGLSNHRRGYTPLTSVVGQTSTAATASVHLRRGRPRRATFLARPWRRRAPVGAPRDIARRTPHLALLLFSQPLQARSLDSELRGGTDGRFSGDQASRRACGAPAVIRGPPVPCRFNDITSASRPSRPSAIRCDGALPRASRDAQALRAPDSSR